MTFDPTPADQPTRASLLMRLRGSRDDQAWMEFAAIYEPVIYRMVKRRGLQDADAREIVQEVLVSVSVAIERFDPHQSGSFRGWLGRIARNATVDRLRTMNTHPLAAGGSSLVRVLHDIAAPVDPLTELEGEFDQDRRRQLFRWAANEVRARTGEVNWMAFWKTSVEGKSADAAAAELRIDVGAVYVARCRIQKRIRELVHTRLSE